MVIGLFGPPSKLADEGDSHDEDNLNREPDVGEGSDDLLDHIFRDLADGHKGAIGFTMGLAHALAQMAHAAANDDKDLLAHWYEGAHRAISSIGDSDD